MSSKIPAAVNIDLGSFYTKVATVNRRGELEKILLIDNTLGFDIPKDRNQVEGFAGYLNEIFTTYKLPRNNVKIALPEKYASTQVIEIPTLTDVELATSIQWQAQQYLPIPKDDLVLSYQVVFRPEKKDEAVTNMRVLLVGMRQSDLTNLLEAFAQANLDATMMETSTLANLRNLSLQPNQTSVMLLDFGANNLNLGVIHNNEIALSLSHPNGSELISKALMNTFNLPKEKAEEYKINYGLDANHFEGKIAQALTPIMQALLNDLNNTLTFYNNKNTLSPISKIFFCGGGALMPGFSEFLRLNLNLEIAPVEVFSNITGNIPKDNHLIYSPSLGLAKKT